MSDKLEITGQKFNRLTAVRVDGVDNLHNILWVFKCDCGNEIVRSASKVKRGIVKSCGCLIHENTTIGDKTRSHGMSQTKIYKIWRGMIDRCNNPKTVGYKYYGKKGVTVCKEWLTFEPFYEWAVANGYREGLTIDRIDSNGNYEPINCRWATWKEQNNNASFNHPMTYKGVTLNQGQWAETFGVTSESLRYWRKRGLSDEEIIEHFMKKERRKK